MKKTLISAILFLMAFCIGKACTSIIVTAKASKDGRPMIFKNRDTSTLSNYCVNAQGPKYKYVGIANIKDAEPNEIWGGHNEKGFAIINTADYNLNVKNEKEELEGVFMREALGQCATMKDFENYLDTHKRPLCVNTNFGVMDAQGNCAYYEVGNEGYVKFDANDPKVAPDGYLMRTNFGFTGNRNKDQGNERYLAITEFMKQAYTTGNMSATYLITEIPRYLKHGLTHLNLNDYMPQSLQDTTMMPFRDYIPRYSTSSCVLIQGVKANEPAAFTTSWMYVGYPLTTVCVPVIINETGLPSTLGQQGEAKSWLAEKGLELKKHLFPYTVANGKDYINVAALINKDHTGILQQVRPVEQQIMQKGTAVIEKMRKKGRLTSDLKAYYTWADEYIRQEFEKIK